VVDLQAVRARAGRIWIRGELAEAFQLSDEMDWNSPKERRRLRRVLHTVLHKLHAVEDVTE
jgi:hypothetical protein